MSAFEKGLITILGCTVVLALIAIPLMLRKVPRNIIYGFRTRATLSDDFVWYEANAHFGRGLLIASAVSSISVLILYGMQGFFSEFFLQASVLVLVLPSLIATLATARFIRTLTPRGPGHSAPR